jgi:uncharacterized protein YjbI with pentapeptide repeats
VPKRENRQDIGGLFVEKLSSALVLRGVSLADLDLSGAHLDGLRLFDVSLANCVFDSARCQDWRIWGSSFSGLSFGHADLRRSALGPWHEGRGNLYERVSFVRADLRGATCQAATFIDCDLSNAALVKIDFQSTSFIRTRFAGVLRQVTFWDAGFKIDKPDPNPMEDVDFSQAEFHEVDFRRLDLDRVTFPAASGHVIVTHYGCVLKRGLAALEEDESLVGRLLRTSLAHRLKWIGPQQKVGVFSLADCDEPGEAERLVELLSRLEKECAAVGDAPR